MDGGGISYNLSYCQLLHRKFPHRFLVLTCHVCEAHILVDSRLLTVLMTADDLNLGVEKPFPGEMGQELVAEEVRINPLLDIGLPGVPLDNFSNPPGDEFILTVGLKEVASPPSFLSVYVLSELSSKGRGNGNVPVLLPLSLIYSKSSAN
jgi:hypothetical protein